MRARHDERHITVSTVHAKIDIRAPVQEVWDTIMDPHRLKDWVTIHRALREVSGEPLRKGSTIEQVLHLRGVPFHVHWTIVDLRPPTHAEWEGRGPAHSQAFIRYDLSENEDGTVFEYTNEFKAPGGRVGNVASRVIVGGISEREAHNSLTRLKDLLERS